MKNKVKCENCGKEFTYDRHAPGMPKCEHCGREINMLNPDDPRCIDYCKKIDKNDLDSYIMYAHDDDVIEGECAELDPYSYQCKDCEAREKEEIEKQIFEEQMKQGKTYQQLRARAHYHSKRATSDAEKQVQSTALDIVNDLSNFNSLSYLKNGSYIFNVTNRMLRKSLELGKPATTLDTYGNTIDALYEIIYEGSGGLKRIPESFKWNLDFIGFTIKFLRADLRHDIAHGNEKEIKAKKERVSQIYTKYCGKPFLGIFESSDFLKIQIEILVEVKAFLTALKQHLMGSPGTALLHDHRGLS